MRDTVRFSTLYQRWIIRQWLLISGPCLCLVPSLIFSSTKHQYSNIGSTTMYRYENSVFTSNFCQKLKNKKQRYQFASQRNFKQTFVQQFFLRKLNAFFCGNLNIEEGDEWLLNFNNQVTYKASVLQTFGFYYNFMKNALFLKAQVIFPRSILY